MRVNVYSEDIAHAVGLTLVLAIIASFIEFTIVGKVSFLPLILGLTLALTVTYHIREYYVEESRGVSKLALTLALLYVSIIASTYYVYPIFPANQSGDFLVYIERSIVFSSGKATLKNLITLHPAIYLLLATVLSLNILNPLLLTRGFMLILTMLNIPLIYVVSKKLYGKLASELALLLSLLINIFWYCTVIVTGLYANFLGLMLALYLLYLIAEYFKGKCRVFLVLALPTMLTMLLSHETTLAILPALWISSIYDLFVRRDLRLLKVSAILSTPLAAVILTAPTSIKFIWDFIVNYVLKLKPMKVKVILITPVNPIYSALETISPMLANVFSASGFSGLILTILCLTYGVLLMFRREYGVRLIIWFWIIILLITSYFTLEAWRLALNSLTLTAIFSALTIKNIALKALSKISLAKIPLKLRKALKYELAVFTIILLIISSNIVLALIRNYSRIYEEHEHQYGVLEAMEWIKNNTPKNAKIVSIVRWEFMYLPYIANRTHLGDYALTPKELEKTVLYKASNGKPIYVVVWNKVHNETTYYINLYMNSKQFKKIWSNNVVSIFTIVEIEK